MRVNIMTTKHFSCENSITTDSPEPYYVNIPHEFSGQRIDSVLSEIIPELSRSRITNWLKNSNIQINGQSPKPSTKVQGGEEVLVIPTLSDEVLAFTPEPIDINVIFKDEHIIVINKPSGLTVHPGNGNWNGTLLNGLLYHFPELRHIPRAGIVHRLDKDTSGLMVVARTLLAQTKLVKLLQDRNVSRIYRAIVEGKTTLRGTINKNIGRSNKNRTQMSVIDIGGKEAITHFRTIEHFDHFSYIECKLDTGRTHQIRVHMQSIGHPIIGDKAYGSRKINYDNDIIDAIKNLDRQALHAISLSFIHPITNTLLNFKAPIADDIRFLLDTLRHDKSIDKSDVSNETTDNDSWEILYVKE